MSGEQDDFQDLRRLLALKRHEQPPPGYFYNFSRNVIAGIRAAEAASRVPQPNWLQRFWSALETKPIAAGAFGAAVCTVLLGGFIYSGSTIDTPDNFGQGGLMPTPLTAEASAVTYSPAPAEPFQHMVGTNGFLPVPGSGSLFRELNTPSMATPQAVNSFVPVPR
jgi:hypothetical protein